jgi:hypothetical protein
MSTEESSASEETPPGYTDDLGDFSRTAANFSDLESLLIQAKYGHRLDVWRDRIGVDTTANAVEAALAATRADSDRAEEAELLKSVHDAYIATAQASLDRSLTRANVVTAAVAAISTLYTGLLGLVYDTSKGGTPLTAGAMIPALFLGISLFLVVTYAAMIRRTLTVGPLLPGGIGGSFAEDRVITFMKWCFSGVYARSRALHAGIVSLGVAVVTLPSPFTKLSGGERWALLGIGLFLVILGALPEIVINPSEALKEVSSWRTSWQRELRVQRELSRETTNG